MRVILLRFLSAFAMGLLAACRPASPGPASPEAALTGDLNVAAAADLQFALPDLAAVFRQANPGVQVHPTIGASGSLVAQIENGAPFDLFLSADTKLVEKLTADGKGAAGTAFRYGQGQLVLWAPKTAAFDVATEGLQAITRPEVRKLAIANPEHAPYGAAAVEMLREKGLYEAVAGKLVLGENVGQAAQFAESGAAEAGLISESLALSPKMAAAGRYAVMPHAPLPQAGVVLASSHVPEAARRFRALLLAPEGQAILKKHGLLPP